MLLSPVKPEASYYEGLSEKVVQLIEDNLNRFSAMRNKAVVHLVAVDWGHQIMLYVSSRPKVIDPWPIVLDAARWILTQPDFSGDMIAEQVFRSFPLLPR